MTVLRTLVLAALLLVSAMSAARAGAVSTESVAAELLASAPAYGDRSLGKADAPVVVIEYGSATCSHCAVFHDVVLPELRRDFIDAGKVRFIFREFPLDKAAMGAFLLTRCVPEDKFFPTLDMMFRRQKRWMSGRPKEELFRIMQLAGMDFDTFESCLENKDLARAIFEAAESARRKFNIRGTPAIFVNGRVVDGHKSYADLKKVIDEELAKQN